MQFEFEVWAGNEQVASVKGTDRDAALREARYHAALQYGPVYVYEVVRKLIQASNVNDDTAGSPRPDSEPR